MQGLSPSDTLELRNDLVSLQFDVQRGGALRQVTELASGTRFFTEAEDRGAPDLVLVCDDEELRLSAMAVVESELLVATDETLQELVIVSRGAGLEVTQTWRLSADSPWAELTLGLKNLRDHEVLIDRYPQGWQQENVSAIAGDLYHYSNNPGGVEYHFAGLDFGGWETLDVVTPEMGYPFFHNRWPFSLMGDCTINVTTSPHGLRMPYVMAYNPQAAGGQGAGLLLSWVDETCMTYFRLEGHDATQTGQANLQLWYARYLRPAESVTLEPIQLVAFTGHYRPMMAAYRDWLVAEHGAQGPQENWDALGDLFVVSTPPFLGEGTDFTFLLPYVDRAAEMNATGFWIGGTWEDTRYNKEVRICENACCIMPVNDVYAPKAAHGGEASLLKLTEYIHGKGMQAICWITGGGLPWPAEPVQKYPDWWTYQKHPIPNEMIKNPSWPGTEPGFGRPDPYLYFPFPELCAPDTTSHGWRAFWQRSFLNAARLGLDGVFIDSMNPMMPNYRRYPWPGESSKGVIPLFRQIRQAVKDEYGEGHFYFPEAGGYLIQEVTDAAEACPWPEGPPTVPCRKTPLTPQETVEFIHDVYLSRLPHTRSWSDVTGVAGITRPWSLYAFFSTQMPRLNDSFYQSEQERAYANETEMTEHATFRPVDSDTPAQAAAYLWVGEAFGLRRKYGELARADMDLDSVATSAAGVLAFARAHEGGLSVVLVNFNPEPVEAPLTLLDPAALGLQAGQSCRVRDLLAEVTGEAPGRLSGVEVSVKAGEVLTVPLGGQNGAVLRFE
ncbi:MAG TPA: hypothetical protein VGM19_13550 [Armatimonadota bacterium]|jgi:hypothetical protein